MKEAELELLKQPYNWNMLNGSKDSAQSVILQSLQGLIYLSINSTLLNNSVL